MGRTKSQQMGDAADIAKTQRSSSAQAAHYRLRITACALQAVHYSLYITACALQAAHYSLHRTLLNPKGSSLTPPPRVKIYHRRLAVWLSGNALASINVVALRQTRLVLLLLLSASSDIDL